MARTEEYLQEFVSGVQSAVQDKLVSALLYGSAARGEPYTPNSDLNVLLIVKDFSLKDMSALRKVLARGQKNARIAPIFWTEEELKNSVDVFPVEFLDMAENHKVLYGKDPVTGIHVDTKNLRHQVEFELRSKLLRLRSGWIEFSDSPKAQLNFLLRSGASLMLLFTQAQKMSGGKLESGVAEPFRKCVLLKKGEIKLDREGITRLYEDVHEAARKTIEIIDGI